MVASGSWLELVLVFVMATGGVVVLGVVMLAFRKPASWKLYWICVAGAFGLLVMNGVWSTLKG